MGVAHGRYLTGNKEGSNGLIVLRVKPTPTRRQTNNLLTPMDNTYLRSIPWGVLVHGTQ